MMLVAAACQAVQRAARTASLTRHKADSTSKSVLGWDGTCPTKLKVAAGCKSVQGVDANCPTFGLDDSRHPHATALKDLGRNGLTRQVLVRLLSPVQWLCARDRGAGAWQTGFQEALFGDIK